MEKMHKKSIIKKKYRLFVVLCLAVYLLLSLIKINYPGIQYDEILFGNAARGIIDDSFITYKFYNFPILLMSYIGALKAYIFYPIFKIFGVSAFSIRIPLIILTAFALYILFETLKNVLNKEIAIAVLLIFSFDASFISQMRYDVGPTAIEFFFKVMVLYFFYKYIKNKKNINVLTIGILMFAGVFNKLNFIWFLNSFAISSALIYWQDFKKIYSNSTKKLKKILSLEIAGTYITCLGYFFLINNNFKLFDQLSVNDIPSRFVNVWNNFQSLINGTSFFNYAFGDMSSPINRIYFFLILSIIIIGFLIYLVYHKSNKFIYKKEYVFFILMLVTTLIQIIITKKATSNWHIFTIYPFIIILIVFSVFILSSLFKSEKLQRLFSLAVLIALIFYQLFMNMQYIKAYSQPTKNINWSKEIYNLIDYTQRSSYGFVSIDWGTHNQLLAFGKSENKYKEMLWWLNDEQTLKKRKWFSENFIDPKNNYAFIMHDEKSSNFINARINFFSIVTESGFKAELIKEFFEDGKVIYQIYIIK